MSYNKIIKKIVTGTIVKNGVTYTLSVATHTDHWTRPDKVAQAVGQRLLNAVIAWDGIPPTGTVEICARYEGMGRRIYMHERQATDNTLASQGIRPYIDGYDEPHDRGELQCGPGGNIGAYPYPREERLDGLSLLLGSVLQFGTVSESWTRDMHFVGAEDPRGVDLVVIEHR
jgi:hypothetical protein